MSLKSGLFITLFQCTSWYVSRASLCAELWKSLVDGGTCWSYSFYHIFMIVVSFYAFAFSVQYCVVNKVHKQMICLVLFIPVT